MRPTIVSISGFSSNVGKTTLMCEMLKRFNGWEAIKISRGHYRSCGKDPQACCISPLLGEHPQIFSGANETCIPRKDTGRYWEAGASNVHWLICTNEQLEEGARLALSKVQTAGVFIEGTSFLKFIPADYSIMVVNPSRDEIKSSALRFADRMNAYFASGSEPDEKMTDLIRERLMKRNRRVGDLKIYFESEIDELVKEVLKITRETRKITRKFFI
jgi:molybdopterin-guanine dinucleotide biosynthesis protein